MRGHGQSPLGSILCGGGGIEKFVSTFVLFLFVVFAILFVLYCISL